MIHIKLNKFSKITLEEWETKILNGNDEYDILNIFYKRRKNGRNETKVKLRHKNCNAEFTRYASSIKNKKISCPLCNNFTKVSYLHSVISTVFMNNYKNVETEYDIGFKGVNGGISRYDLYIPNYNNTQTLIEFQSRFHDTEEQKIIDENKKEYAIKKGYNFISIDHRDMSIEEAVSFFFGNNFKLNLDVLDLSRFNRLNLKQAQELLNQYLTYKEIEKIMGVGNGTINHAVNSKRLQLPPNHHRVTRNIHSIIQLSMNGDFIDEFNTSYEMMHKLGYRVIVTKNKQQCSYGYFWLVKEDYESNNYTIPLYTRNHIQKFVLLDSNNNIIEEFNNLQDAVDYIKTSSKRYILDVLLHKQKDTKGYKFMFLKEYNEKFNNNL